MKKETFVERKWTHNPTMPLSFGEPKRNKKLEERENEGRLLLASTIFSLLDKVQ